MDCFEAAKLLRSCSTHVAIREKHFLLVTLWQARLMSLMAASPKAGVYESFFSTYVACQCVFDAVWSVSARA